jgi:hypothetical protein
MKPPIPLCSRGDRAKEGLVTLAWNCLAKENDHDLRVSDSKLVSPGGSPGHSYRAAWVLDPVHDQDYPTVRAELRPRETIDGLGNRHGHAGRSGEDPIQPSAFVEVAPVPYRGDPGDPGCRTRPELRDRRVGMNKINPMTMDQADQPDSRRCQPDPDAGQRQRVCLALDAFNPDRKNGYATKRRRSFEGLSAWTGQIGLHSLGAEFLHELEKTPFRPPQLARMGREQDPHGCPERFMKTHGCGDGEYFAMMKTRLPGSRRQGPFMGLHFRLRCTRGASLKFLWTSVELRTDGKCSIQEAVLDRLGEMHARDAHLMGEVGDGAGHLEDAVMRAGAMTTKAPTRPISAMKRSDPEPASPVEADHGTRNDAQPALDTAIRPGVRRAPDLPSKQLHSRA